MIDPEALAAAQTDEQLAHGPDAAARAYVDSIRKQLRTSIPGIIVDFDKATQTATVQIAIQKLFIGDDPGAGWVNLPPCGNVPVFLPGCKRFVMTFIPEKDDECLLVFSDRAIDGWFKQGGVQQPTEYRLHDLSDGFAFVGFSSEPNAIADLKDGAMELRTRDGATVIRLEAGMVTAGAPGSADFLALAGKVHDALAMIKTHMHGSNGGGPIVASPDLTTLDPNVAASNVKGS